MLVFIVDDCLQQISYTRNFALTSMSKPFEECFLNELFTGSNLSFREHSTREHVHYQLDRPPNG